MYINAYVHFLYRITDYSKVQVIATIVPVVVCFIDTRYYIK